MIRFRVKSQTNPRRVKRAADHGQIKSLGRAAATLRKIARRSIRQRKKPSRPGQPPHTHTRRLRVSILYHATKDYAIVGADASIIGQGAGVHEHGGRRGVDRYPPRPFMQPALDVLKPRLNKFWADSIH